MSPQTNPQMSAQGNAQMNAQMNAQATTLNRHNMGQAPAPQAMNPQTNAQMNGQTVRSSVGSSQMNAQMNAQAPPPTGNLQNPLWRREPPKNQDVRAVPRAEPMNRLNTMILNPMSPLPAREAKTQPDARRAASPTKEAKDDSTGRMVLPQAEMKHQEVSTSQPSQPQIHTSKCLVNNQVSSDESDGDYSDTESDSDSDGEVVENTKQAEAKEGSKDVDLALYFQKELGEDAAPVKAEASKVEARAPGLQDQRLLQPGVQEKTKTEDSVPSILWKAVMLGAGEAKPAKAAPGAKESAKAEKKTDAKAAKTDEKKAKDALPPEVEVPINKKATRLGAPGTVSR
eukprot:s828_g8.t1